MLSFLFLIKESGSIIIMLRCVIVPHIGSGTTETRIGMTTLAAKNVVGGVLGEDMLAEYGK
jgi:lactate dehydrogenase-like 2-hydroxyacid dehydrogenase